MAAPELVEIPEAQLTVELDATMGVRFTPNELRALKVETGRSMTDLLGPEADDADRMQTIAWLRLRRDGNPVAWDECGDVGIEINVPDAPDPTNGEP